MFVISSNVYFIEGVRALSERKKFMNGKDCDNYIIFDACKSYTYFIRKNALRNRRLSDPLSAVVNLCDMLYPSGCSTNFITGRSLISGTELTNKHLTNTEKDVISLILIGMSPKRIAARLNISDKTVSAHRTNAIEKLGIRNSRVLYLLLQAWRCVLPEFNLLINNEGKGIENERGGSGYIFHTIKREHRSELSIVAPNLIRSHEVVF